MLTTTTLRDVAGSRYQSNARLIRVRVQLGHDVHARSTTSTIFYDRVWHTGSARHLGISFFNCSRGGYLLICPRKWASLTGGRIGVTDAWQRVWISAKQTMSQFLGIKKMSVCHRGAAKCNHGCGGDDQCADFHRETPSTKTPFLPWLAGRAGPPSPIVRKHLAPIHYSEG